MKYLAYSLIVIICLLNTGMANAKKSKKVTPASFIRIDGQNLIAPGGEKFFIKGTNLGNWLNPEGYMFLFKKTSAPRLIDQAFKEMVGHDFTNEFWKLFKDNYVTRADINSVSYTHLRAHETRHDLVCRLLLEKKKQQKTHRGIASVEGMHKHDENKHN